MPHRRSARRARNALGWGLLAFAAVQLGTTLLLERTLPKLRDPHYADKAAAFQRRLRTCPAEQKPCIVVVLGSSRVAEGLCGTAVEEDLGRRLGRPVALLNLGIEAECPWHELINLERLLADDIRPDVVVAEAFPFYLSEKSVATLPHMLAERLSLHDRAVLKRHHLPLWALTRWRWQCVLAPWYAHRREMLHAVAPALLPEWLERDLGMYGCCDAGGYATGIRDWGEATRTAGLAVTRNWYGSWYRDYRVGGPFRPALSALLERCREEGIPAALLLMPEGSVLQSLYPSGAWPAIEKCVRDLARPCGAAVIDAHDWFAEEDFLDSHHFLPPRAASFTRRLADEALLPLLRGAGLPPPSVHRARLAGRVSTTQARSASDGTEHPWR